MISNLYVLKSKYLNKFGIFIIFLSVICDCSGCAPWREISHSDVDSSFLLSAIKFKSELQEKFVVNADEYKGRGYAAGEGRMESAIDNFLRSLGSATNLSKEAINVLLRDGFTESNDIYTRVIVLKYEYGSSIYIFNKNSIFNSSGSSSEESWLISIKKHEINSRFSLVSFSSK